MKINEDITIGEVVAKDYRTASVFESFGIDFCCKGNRTINEVCETRNTDSKDLIEDIHKVLQESGITQINDYNDWTLDKLALHIEEKHHKYVEKQIPVIKQYLDKICAVHGKQHPELFKVQELFNGAAGGLCIDMKKVACVLFPFIYQMVRQTKDNRPYEMPGFGTVQNPIQMMMGEHDNEGERFRQINEITQHYTSPDDACG